MISKQDQEKQVLMAARENGIQSILFRNALGRKLGLNSTESMCLSMLGIKGNLTPTEIAYYTGLTSGATTTMLDRLEKKQCILRKSNPNDRRGVLVEINPEYGKRAGPLVAGIQKAHKELIARYSEKELTIITNFFTRFTKNIIDHTKEVEEAM